MNIDYVIKAVYDMLMSQTFHNWHESDFKDYVEGEYNSKGTNEIYNDIYKLLNIKREL